MGMFLINDDRKNPIDQFPHPLEILAQNKTFIDLEIRTSSFKM